jgi:hypothetical protein
MERGHQIKLKKRFSGTGKYSKSKEKKLKNNKNKKQIKFRKHKSISKINIKDYEGKRKSNRKNK